MDDFADEARGRRTCTGSSRERRTRSRPASGCSRRCARSIAVDRRPQRVRLGNARRRDDLDDELPGDARRPPAARDARGGRRGAALPPAGPARTRSWPSADAFDAAWMEGLRRLGHTVVEREERGARSSAASTRSRATRTARSRRSPIRAATASASSCARRPSTVSARRPVPEVFRPLYRDGRILRLLDQRLLPARGGLARARRSRRDRARRSATWPCAARRRSASPPPTAPRSRSARSGTGGPPRERFDAARALLAASRPTAVNLFAALERMAARFDEVSRGAGRTRSRRLSSRRPTRSPRRTSRRACRIGAFGAALLSRGTTVLTHCNAGALATAGYGTALGVIRGAIAAGKPIRVLADETRPFLQGARLTAWELARDGIPVEILTDSMAGHFLSRGEIAAVVVGADRIAANGDTANKIGTYSARRAREGERRPVLRRRADDDARSRLPRRRRRSRSRSAAPPRCSRSAGTAIAPDGRPARATSPSTSRPPATSPRS